MREFLENYNLYEIFTLQEKYVISRNNLIIPTDFVGITFEHYCQKEKRNSVFEIGLEFTFDKSNFNKDSIPDQLFYNKKLDYTFKVKCKCSSCKNYHIDMFLHVFSDEPIPKSTYVALFQRSIEKQRTPNSSNEASIYIEKVGVYPEIKPELNRTVEKYFDRESKEWYYKGVSSITKNFGVGALAYFRRIIEKELIHIIEDINELPDSHSNEINELLKTHNKNPQISTIYENIFEYLPNSLKSLGDNPIKLLYNETSNGLHKLSEKESLEKAKLISRLLEFVIVKIYEEKSEIKELRESIKNLKK